MLIDRYLLAETWRRLGVVLAVVLVSLVLERILRLFDVVSLHGGPVGMVWEMAAYLVPHYLGLALPAGFFLSIFLQVTRLGDDNEIDALLGCGLSPARFAMPFLASALLLVAVSIVLFGYAQPYSRYAYRTVYYLATNIPWKAQIPEYAFASIGKNVVVTADRVTDGGDKLEKVFVHQWFDGHEVVTTAARGELDFDIDRSRFGLWLYDGVQAVISADGRVAFVHFENLELDRSFSSALPEFRPRGDDAREYSLDELVGAAANPSPTLPRDEIVAELHGRLVRAASLIFLPFLAIPMGLAAKRQRRGIGIVFGSVVLLLYHYILQTLEGLADSGRLSVLSLWVATGGFAAISLGLFWRAQSRPGENPLDHLFFAMEAVAMGLRTLVRRWMGARP
ncbi:MAG: LptF/LptG family permease [Magnetospirillum sp.]